MKWRKFVFPHLNRAGNAHPTMISTPVVSVHSSYQVTVMALECFYTLPDSIENYRIIWRIEPRLRDRIHLLRQQITPLSEFNERTQEAIIARSLFEKLQQHPESELLRTHWIAFLERRCEQVANKILSFCPATFGSAYFQDLFLIGCEVVSDPVKFFNKFDNQRSHIDYWYPTLKRFSDTKIKHILLPKLRLITGRGTLGRTNLGLVARSSRKQVREALQHSGYPEAKLSQYLLIWQCFQEFRNSINLAVHQFQPEQFQGIAKRYCEFREELALPENPIQDINEEAIKTWLENIGTAIRQFLDPPLDSLDTPLNSQNNEDISLIENITYEPTVDEEMNQKIAALRELISHLLNGLEETQEKQLLFLRYGLELKQGQIGQELQGQAQYQISRLLQRLNNRILTEIWNWVRQHLEIEPSSEGCNEIESVLIQHYFEQIEGFFITAIRVLGRQSLELLKLFYLVKLKPPEIGEKIHKAEAEVQELLEAMRQWLSSSLTEKIKYEIQLQFQPQGAAEQRIAVIIESRLERILQLYLQEQETKQ